ncbi:hypothetical protein [Aeromicrobium duanguangcaii]|uniref:DUF4352 domain-containing protein n=1 Tax=Aeromicrobium duanguangcaii TaxID=2968086 RepID=A0ABY5KJM8_9ACTN|nr:hypothetical protein [Aeromicrobium duanguangcaii]MCD9152925.1 hypothetical protein [Aeromicrobium duanguangcaii]UUI69969.1 hypothetical protein NP095_07700 [Aeromicrobium duanguangcaii]
MRALAAAVLLFALTACSGGDTEKSSDSTAGLKVPAGITLSEPGTEKKVGESLAIGYPSADDEAGTALALGVTRVDKAPRRDLSLYRIPAGMQPYYVRVMVGNRGPAEASFPEGLPWWLHVAGDTLTPATAVPGRFAKCAPPKVGRTLAAGATAKGCLLFLVPRGTAVESVDFQPGGVTTAVRWRP